MVPLIYIERRELSDVKKLETSKKLLLAAYTFAGLISACVIIGTFIGVDVTNLTIVASAAWAEVAVHTAVYSKKATAENRLKIAYGLIQKLSRIKRFEPDIIVQLFDGVIKEG